MYAIFDLDGCLSDDSWRKHHLPDFDAYNKHLREDTPINMDVYQRVAEQVSEIMFVTGRPDKHRAHTEQWLKKHLPKEVSKTDTRLVMRPDDDYRPSPVLKVSMLKELEVDPGKILYAFDDRQDVIDAFQDWGVVGATILDIPEGHQSVHPFQLIEELHPSEMNAAAILKEAAHTFAERNAVYGDNYTRVAPVMRALFPDGVPSELVMTNSWHLFELMVVKLTRFANSGLEHRDSVRDTAVYAAMIEANIARGEL